jgi:hypothetical protein
MPREGTHDSLYDIREIIPHSDKQRSLLRVVGSDLVDPAKNQWPGTILV